MDNRTQYVEACKEVVERVLAPGQTLMQYVRDKKGRAVGTVVAFRNPRSNTVEVGWSLCRIKQEKFDKLIGLNKAISRSVELCWADMHAYDKVPHTVKNVYLRVVERAKKFFKVD